LCAEEVGGVSYSVAGKRWSGVGLGLGITEWREHCVMPLDCVSRCMRISYRESIQVHACTVGWVRFSLRSWIPGPPYATTKKLVAGVLTRTIVSLLCA
jgi:hypothetical protein